MGILGELLEWILGEDGDEPQSEGKVDPGGGDIVTATHYPPIGFDSHPLPGDYVLLVPGPEMGSYQIAGYVDPENAGRARAGDLRLYVRDGKGAVQGELHLTQDGAEPDWAGEVGALIARADRVDQRFDDLEAKYNAHTHPQWACAGGTTGVVQDAETTSSILPADQANGLPTGADKGWIT